MSPETHVEEVITGFLGQLTPLDFIEPDTNIFEAGIVNSLLALQLINRMEQHFQFEIGEDDLDRENFSSIRNMTQFVLRKVSDRCATAV
jgi:acyl carrier protein